MTQEQNQTKKKTKAIAVPSKIYSLDKPTQMVELATILRSHIVKNKLYVPISSKNYVMVEGWQFAGGMMGLFPQITEVKRIEPGIWQATCNIIEAKTGKVISTGIAICSKDEAKKKTFDEYAILSMAQTRAIGKAYRNLIGWIMKLSGYESTPAEEMVNAGTKIETSDAPVEEQKIGNNPKVEELKKMLAGDSDAAKLAYLQAKTGIILQDFNISETHANRLITELLQAETKK